MRLICAQDIARHLDFSDFIEALRQGFCSDIIAPTRHHHKIERAQGSDATMLLMPAWTNSSDAQSSRGYSGVKIANVYPDNAKIGKASVQAVYLLNDGESGEPIALIDGQALTFWRTSCASALASSYLSRENSKSLLMVGSGALAPWLIKAHMAVREIENVYVWNHNEERAKLLVAQLIEDGINAELAGDLQNGVEQCDIVSAATLSKSPLIKGRWLKPGTHLDLVGGFTPQMREADDEAIKRAALFVDTMDGALSEPGDIVQPIADGVIKPDDLLADLFGLSHGRHLGRAELETPSDQITLFKSTGASLEDLVGAILIAEKVPK